MPPAIAPAVSDSSHPDMAESVDGIRELVKSRIRADDAFGSALFAEAVEVMLSDDMATAGNVLSDYIEATIGFADLSAQSGLPAEMLRDMFGSAGDPRAADLFRVLGLLQRHQGIRLQVGTAARA